MPDKLKYYTEKGKKIYTLKEENQETKEKTKSAHYKFIKIKSSEEEI